MTEATLDDVGRLFGPGGLAAVGEAELVARFAATRDEAAFEAIVSRHGPMVLGVCRRMLRDPHDVDDAFQATFRVLARKAGGLRRPERLGPWLYGVATRVSSRARAASSRRRARERPATVEPADECACPEVDPAEVRSALDEELSRLGARDRAAVVLCLLEGLSSAEAAGRLGWPVGTLKSRLSRARARLRSRLARRGLDPGASMLPATAASPLGRSTIRAAIRFAARGASAADAAPASVLSLTEGVLSMSRRIWISAAATFVAALGVAALASQGPTPGPSSPEANTKPPDGGSRREVVEAGRDWVAAANESLNAVKSTYGSDQAWRFARYADASTRLREAEIATSEAGGASAARRHLRRLETFAGREFSDYVLHQGNQPQFWDVAETQARLAEARYRLAQLGAGGNDAAADDDRSGPRGDPSRDVKSKMVRTQVHVAGDIASDATSVNRDLITLILVTVAPESWKVAPGFPEPIDPALPDAVGRIELDPKDPSHSLLITNTGEVQDEIEALFRRLRRMPPPPKG